MLTDLSAAKAFVVRQLGMSPTVEELSEEFNRLLSQERETLVRACDELLQHAALDLSLADLTEIIVALWPESMPLIERILQKKDSTGDYAIHAEMWFAISLLRNIPAGARKKLLAMVENYLLTVDCDTCHAASLAGDLLGNDWDMNEALPILERLARTARFPVGRDAALFGMCEIGLRSSSHETLSKLKSVFADILENDLDSGVRSRARLSLWQLQRGEDRKKSS